MLKQGCINLLDNAVKFTPRGQTIEVAIEETSRQYTITVGNPGSYIPPEQREKIFNKFYQCDESHAAQGNGIGLAIVRRVVTLHGGRVWADCTNQGTVFTVELPKGL